MCARARTRAVSCAAFCWGEAKFHTRTCVHAGDDTDCSHASRENRSSRVRALETTQRWPPDGPEAHASGIATLLGAGAWQCGEVYRFMRLCRTTGSTQPSPQGSTFFLERQGSFFTDLPLRTMHDKSAALSTPYHRRQSGVSVRSDSTPRTWHLFFEVGSSCQGHPSLTAAQGVV